ncbi:transposase family protein, partial [Kineosporia babensis]|uniref:transposase family protein n=1 Tax=Kineosporia babensis TaxID=499548 RepID=UPI0038B3323A
MILGSRSCLSVGTGRLLQGLLPHLRELAIGRVDTSGPVVLIEARSEVAEFGCTACGGMSDRVHSRYVRRLADAAIAGREVQVLLTVRRFRCLEPTCLQATFVEQVPGVAGRYQRRTRPLRGVLEKTAVMLGGRPGARLVERLAMSASRSS